MATVDIYCPCCGSWQNGVMDIAPGPAEWTCPNCQTEFTINIGFGRKEDERDKV